MAFPFITTNLVDDLILRLTRERRIREDQRKAAEVSARNFRTGLENGFGAVEKLAVLLRFEEVVEQLTLPESIKTSVSKLCGHLRDYAVDLEFGLKSSEHASGFATQQNWIHNNFEEQTFRSGSCGERFHRGASKYLEDGCQEITVVFEAHCAGGGVVTKDEYAFILQFKEFSNALSTVMGTLQ